MCSNALYMFRLIKFRMDAGSSLRWLSASTMMQCHHFDSKRDNVSHNLSQVVWVLCNAATVFQWTAYQCAKTLCKCLIGIWEAV